jgi:hypothetical protein
MPQKDRDWSQNMVKANTVGRVNPRSDRWFVGGITTIIVSGLLTISWRVYTVGKIPFWSAWPGILGVAVVGAGFIMIAVGARLDQAGKGPGRLATNGDSNSSDQR